MTSLDNFLSTLLQEAILYFSVLEHVLNSTSGQIRCKCLAQHNLSHFQRKANKTKNPCAQTTHFSVANHSNSLFNGGIWVTRLKINMSFMLFLFLYKTLLWVLAMSVSWQDFGQICWRSIYLNLLKRQWVIWANEITQMERSGGSISQWW